MTPAWRRSALCMPPSWAGNSPVSIDSSGVIHQLLLMSLAPETRLTLGQLRTFLAVASTGSVRAAADHPEVAVSLEVGNRRRVADLLSHHEADLAIGGRPPPGAETLAVKANRLVLVSAPGGSAAPTAGARAENPQRVGVSRPGSGGPPAKSGRSRGRKGRAVTRGQLAAATWLLREPGSGTRATAE